jgi:hypothetical protein
LLLVDAQTKYAILLSLLLTGATLWSGSHVISPAFQNGRGTRSMRFATLCVAACFVTGASVTLSESPAIADPNTPVAVNKPASDAAPAASSAPASSDSSSSDPAAAQPRESNEALDQGLAAPEPPERPALSRTELCGTAVRVAEANNLPAPFFTRLIQQESGFKPHVVSSAGAQGIAQFMPRTASSVGLRDPFEPIAALAASGRYLAGLVRQFGNLGLAAAAYNAGARRVRDWISRRGKLPAETRQYVHRITGRPAENWASRRMRASRMELARQTSCPDARSPAAEAHLPSHVDSAGPQSRKAEAPAPAGTRMTRAALTAHHSLPRPSRFVVGVPVPAAIKAAERAALARQKTQHGASRRADRKPTRFASAG